MDLSFSKEHEAFRKEARAWIAANLDRTWREALRDPAMGEARARRAPPRLAAEAQRGGLPRHGLAEGVGRPRRDRGREAIFEEELARADAPPDPEHPRHRALRARAHPPRQRGSSAAASSRRCSPATRSGARASASPAPAATSRRSRSRAELDGDHFVLNGQKVLDDVRPVGRLDLRARAHRPEGPLRRHLVHPRQARHARASRCGRSGRSPARASSARCSSRTRACRARTSSARSARAGGSR